MPDQRALRDIQDARPIVTAIDGGLRFPEALDVAVAKYEGIIQMFAQLVQRAQSSAELLRAIRSPDLPARHRIGLLKLFRRCVSPVIDTEMARKIVKVHTNSLIDSFGHTFKPIDVLRRQLLDFETAEWTALAALLGEYDSRRQSGYQLTSLFFDWFSSRFDGAYSIDGPRGAGRDIELSSLFPDFDGSYPCDFVITRTANMAVVAVGFARYDSTRGGAQSDDRTGGNANKVEKARHYCDERGVDFKIIFLADGPGLLHSDTLSEAKQLDDQWDGRVRVVTLKLAPDRITEEWFES